MRWCQSHYVDTGSNLEQARQEEWSRRPHEREIRTPELCVLIYGNSNFLYITYNTFKERMQQKKASECMKKNF